MKLMGKKTLWLEVGIPPMHTGLLSGRDTSSTHGPCDPEADDPEGEAANVNVVLADQTQKEQQQVMGAGAVTVAST